MRGILRNPSYAGRALSNRTQVAPARGRKSAVLPAGPGVSHAPRPEPEWITVPVPPVVPEEAFAQVQAKLDANQQGAARNTRALARARGGAWLPQELQARQATIGQALSQLDAAARQKLELGAVADGIEAFCQTVRAGLATATFAQRRQLAELLIDRVVVTDGRVEIRYALPTSPDGPHRPFCQLRKDQLDVPQVVVAADHEACGDGGAVGGGGEAGDVAFQPGQVPGLGLGLAVDAFGGAVQGDEPVPLDRGEPGDALAALVTCSSILRSVRRARSALY